MQLAFPFPPYILTIVIISAYIASLWWLLRTENKRTVCALVVITIIALGLRLHDITNLPPGLNDDEVKTLRGAQEYLENGKIFVLGVEGPVLHAVLFQLPLAQLLDSTFWSMRLYPIILGALAVPASFAIGRGLLFGAVPSFVLTLLVATLPWSLFWSRISWGGEILFYQALLLAALARILWKKGGKGDVAVGVIGLSGLLWEYTAAWAMIGMPFVAFLIAANWRQRFLSLSVAALALVAWIPWLLNVAEWIPHVSSKVPESYSSESYASMAINYLNGAVRQTLSAFLYPEGNVYWISMHSVAMHPTIVLVLAALGAVTTLVRRSLFIVLGFMGGLAPTLMSYHGAPSTHRMIGSFIFLSIACAAFFDFVSKHLDKTSRGVITTTLAGAFVAVASYQSIVLFFSPTFWKESGRVFMHSETLISESIRLPATTPLAVDGQLFRFLEARHVRNPGISIMTYETWMPTGTIEHAISPTLPTLASFYKESLPPHQVTEFAAFEGPSSVRALFTEQDVVKWRQFGWTVERLCSPPQSAPSRIPAFILERELGWNTICYNPRGYLFKATWTREPTEMQLHLFGNATATVETSLGTILEHKATDTTPLIFTLHSDERITIAIQGEHGTSARLLEGTGSTAKLSRIDSFKP